MVSVKFLSFFAVSFLVLGPKLVHAWSFWGAEPHQKETGEPPAHRPSVQGSFPSSLTYDGDKKLAELQALSEHTTHLTTTTPLSPVKSSRASVCWTEALEVVQNSCKILQDDEETRTRLAVRLTACHLLRAMAPVEEEILSSLTSCSSLTPISICTRYIVNNAALFQMFTTMTVHAEELCRAASSEAFQARLETTIDKLSLSSSQTLNGIEKAREQTGFLQEGLDVVVSQHETISNNVLELSTTVAEGIDATEKDFKELSRLQELLRKEQELSAQATHASTEALKNLVTEQSSELSAALKNVRELQSSIETSSKEFKSVQAELLTGISGLRKFQFLLLGEFMEISSVIWYCSMSVFILFTSSARQTSACRFPLMIGILLCAGFERIVAPALVLVLNGNVEFLGTIVFVMRRLFYVYFSLAFAYATFSFRDEQREGKELLYKVLDNQEKLCNKFDTKNHY